MKVINLLGQDFDCACNLLAQKVSDSYAPDLIIGVLTGGGYIARKINDLIPNKSNRKYIEVKIQRTTTKQKDSKLISFILKYSPTFLLNKLRILESIISEYRTQKHNPKREGKIILTEGIDSYLKEAPRKILIVDDAIDSGATIDLIHKYLSTNYPLSEVKIAVITVTTRRPLIEADFYLYHNQILVRFPWSKDVKR